MRNKAMERRNRRRGGLLSHWSSKLGSHQVRCKGEDKENIKDELWKHAKLHPLATPFEFKKHIISLGYRISLRDLLKIFKQWRWSFTRPHIKQCSKYKRDNMLYYGTFIYSTNTIPWANLKFFDQITINTSGQSFRLSLLTALDLQTTKPFHADMYKSTPNDTEEHQISNLKIFMDYLVANSFDDGDYFIVDPSHPFLSTILEYIAPLEEIGVKLVTLPKYSQELNACAGVAELVRKKVRDDRDVETIPWMKVVYALARVSFLDVFKEYKKSIASR